MDLPTWLGLYLIIASGISLTVYLQIFKPAVTFLEDEILVQKTPYSGVMGFLVWMGFCILVAPWGLFLLLQNDNERLKQEMALKLSESYMEDKGDE